MGEAFTSTELSTLETYIKTLSEEDRSDATKARILFDLMVKVKDASGFETVIEAFLSGLTWEDGLIFGLTSTVTIASLFGPGALEFPLEIVEAIGDAYFIGEDINNAIKICKPAGDEVTASPGAFSEPTISIKTFSGNYLTFVDNGDMGGDAQVLHTNSKTADFWQKFTIVPVDVAKLTFAIRTPSGYYLSAVNGGGLGEGSQPFFPPKHPPPALHTNATTASTWEKFILKYNTDGTYSLRSTSGWYLTFLQGGGVGGDNDWWCPLHTDARVIGDWETFSFTLPG